MPSSSLSARSARRQGIRARCKSSITPCETYHLGCDESLTGVDSHDPLNSLEEDDDCLEEDEEQLKADRLYAETFKGSKVCPVSTVLDEKVKMFAEIFSHLVLLRADASHPEPISDLAREATQRSV